MTLPVSGQISANDINVEATRSGTANAPLSGTSSTPQAGSLVKIYENSGVNQSAPHSYSEFHGKSYTSVTAYSSSTTQSFGAVCTSTIGQTYYHSGSGAQPVNGDYVYSDSGATTVLIAGYYHFDTNKWFRITNSTGLITGTINTC
jgi:hypothetical protein